MARYDNEESFFSDADLDELPHSALEELESNALQFTQAQQTQYRKTDLSSDYGDEFGDEDLDDAVVIDESRSTPAANLGYVRRNSTQSRSVHRSTIPSSSLASRQRQPIPPPPVFDLPKSDRPRIQLFQHDSVVAQQGSLPDSGPDNQIDSLQRQIEALLKERNNLQEDLNSKAGEIAIVRAKQEKTAKEYEREMIAIRKLNEDRIAKQAKQIETSDTLAKHAAVEKEFLKQDLAEESAKLRRLKGAKDSLKLDGEVLSTPKKSKALPHRDGFEDDEIDLLSPSKLSPSKISPSKISPSKSRRTTSSPAKPGKRKRKPAESPAGALEVINDEPPVEQPRNPEPEVVIQNRLPIQDDRFDFLSIMLNHRGGTQHTRTLEQLGKYRLPSNPNESLESTILGKIPSLGYRKTSKDLPIEFCNLLTTIWSQCQREQFFVPIPLLVDMLIASLELKTTAVAPHLIETLVPVVQSTLDELIIPRFQHTKIKETALAMDSTACLSLLHLIALGCMGDHRHIKSFWKRMRFDTIIMSISSLQSISDQEIMLRLLSTSIFENNFGARSSDAVEDKMVLHEVLERNSKILVDIPFYPESTKRLEHEVIFKLRIRILQLWISMTKSTFAANLIITHQHAIGRLVCLMSDELDSLYDYTTHHEDSARIINLAARLLYHIVTKYDNVLDMQKKLAAIHGGEQKYLLCLTRLNYSEDDLLLEAGIDPDVAAYANDMLTMRSTMEEGDAIHSAFGGH